MKALIKRGLHALGYELVRVSRFRELLLEHVARHPDFTFVQIGANDGILFDNLYYFVTEFRCRGLVVEPLSDYFERLRLNYLHYPRITPVRTAVHPTDSTCRIFRLDPAVQADHPNWTAGIASLSPDHHKQFDGLADHIIFEEVPAIPLMRLLEEHAISDLDLLQIDTEGFDAEILRMLDFSRVRPAIIKHEHVGLSAADRFSVEQLLTRNGYVSFEEGGDTIAVAR